MTNILQHWIDPTAAVARAGNTWTQSVTRVALAYTAHIVLQHLAAQPTTRAQGTCTCQIAIQPAFAAAGNFNGALAPVKVGQKWGFINRTGRLVVGPVYAAARMYNDGRAPVKTGTQWGYIDMAGETVVPAQYDNAYPYADGLARVQKNGK